MSKKKVSGPVVPNQNPKIDSDKFYGDDWLFKEEEIIRLPSSEILLNKNLVKDYISNGDSTEIIIHVEGNSLRMIADIKCEDFAKLMENKKFTPLIPEPINPTQEEIESINKFAEIIVNVLLQGTAQNNSATT